MKKKLLVYVMTLVMIVNMLPMSAFADDLSQANGNVVVVSGSEGESTEKGDGQGDDVSNDTDNSSNESDSNQDSDSEPSAVSEEDVSAVASVTPNEGIPTSGTIGTDAEYSLDADLYLNGTLTITGKVTFNLNGYMIVGNGKTRLFLVNGNGSLTINGGEQTTVHKGTVDASGLWSPSENGTVSLAGGLITGGYMDKSGSCIRVESNGTVQLDSVTIAGNKTTGGSYGSPICIYRSNTSCSASGTFNKTSICYNISTGNSSRGGGIVTNGDVTMDKCEVYNNQAAYGGGIATLTYSGTPEIAISRSSIHDNVATAAGSALYVDKGSLTLDLDTIANELSTVYATGATLNLPTGYSLSGGVISEAVVSTDNVFAVKDSAGNTIEEYVQADFSTACAKAVEKGATVYLIGDADISDMYEVSGTLNVDLNGYLLLQTGNTRVFYVKNGGVLNIASSDATATHQGTVVAGVWTPSDNGDVTLRGGVIAGGYANGWGGAIYVATGGSVTLKNIVLAGNQVASTNVGGALYTEGNATLTNVEVCYNKTERGRGAGVFAAGKTVTFILDGGSVHDNYGGDTSLGGEVGGSSNGCTISIKNACKIYNDGNGKTCGVYAPKGMVDIDEASASSFASLNTYIRTGSDGNMTVPEGYKIETIVSGDPSTYCIVDESSADSYCCQIGDKKYMTLQAAVNNASDGDVITLLRDVQLENALVVEKDGKTVTLNLDGHMIVGNGSERVITLKSGTLVVDGVSSTSETSVEHVGTIVEGLWTPLQQGEDQAASEDSVVVFTGGVITGGSGKSGGGGVYVGSGATLTMSNVTVAGNTASGSVGGGLYLADASSVATFDNVAVCYNVASTNGRGVGIYNTGSLSMTDSSIYNNTSAVGSGSEFAISGSDSSSANFGDKTFIYNDIDSADCAIYHEKGVINLSYDCVESLAKNELEVRSSVIDNISISEKYQFAQVIKKGGVSISGIYMYRILPSADSYDCIYFDLSCGDITVDGNSYSGYITVTKDTVVRLKGLHTNDNKYYVFQSSEEHKGYLTADGVQLPGYESASVDGKSWAEYIENNSSVENVVSKWSEYAEATGRTADDTHRVIVTTEGSASNIDITIDNVYSTLSSSTYENNVNTGSVHVNAESGGMVTLRAKGDSRLRNIYYRNESATSGGRLVITNPVEETSGTITVADYVAHTADSTRLLDCLAIIGASNKAEYGLTFSGATVFAGFLKQTNDVWAERINVAFRTCVGGGNNRYGEVTITGGSLTAVSNGTSSAIGGGGGYNLTGSIGKVSITGGSVYAYASGIYSVQEDRIGFVPTTAIGGSSTFAGSVNDGGSAKDSSGNTIENTTVSITGGYVYAESRGGNAIGGGGSRNNAGGNATVSIGGSAQVVAVSTSAEVSTNQAGTVTMSVPAGNGIGGGVGVSGGDSTIDISGNAQVWATAIGGGSAVSSGSGVAAENGGSAEVVISGGTLMAGTVGGGTTSNSEKSEGSASVKITGGTIAAQFLMKSASEGCSFTMTDGQIVSDDAIKFSCEAMRTAIQDKSLGTRKSDGGAVWMDDTNGKVSISGNASISGRSAKDGGALYVAGGSVEMSGGVISGCMASEDGGAVYVSGGNVAMSGGTISGCSAANNGGAIAVVGYMAENDYAVSITDSATIDSNSAQAGNGGGIYVYEGNLHVSGGTISKNTALNWKTLNSIENGNGGGICVLNGNVLFENGTISGNKCSRFGGGLYILGEIESSDSSDEDDVVLLGGEISGNIAAQAGGGLTAFKANVHLKRSTNSDGVTSGVRIENNQSVNGGGIYLRYNARLCMEGGYVENNHAVSLSALDALDSDAKAFFSNIDKDKIAETSITSFGSSDNDFGGNGGGIFVHNATLEISGTEGNSSSGSISYNVADRNGGGLYLIQKAALDNSTNENNNESLSVDITNGSIVGNVAGRHGGGIAMFQEADSSSRPVSSLFVRARAASVSPSAETNVSGVVEIAENEAENGGGLYVGGGTLTVTGGIVHANVASGTPDESVTTAADPDSNVGVGGGIYVYKTGNLVLKIVDDSSNNNDSSNNIGVYDNAADFAAADVYCAPGSTSAITIPAVTNMYLEDYEGHVIGKATGWFFDYADDDTGDTLLTDPESIQRYDSDASDAIKQQQLYSFSESKTVDDYLCLTLGFVYTRINVKIYERSNDKDAVFKYEAIIKGKISELESAVYNQAELVFKNDSDYEIIDSGSSKDADGYGVAKVTFSLKAGESIELKGIPVGSELFINAIDADGSYVSSYKFSDTNVYQVGSDIGKQLGSDPIAVILRNYKSGISDSATINVTLHGFYDSSDSNPNGDKTESLYQYDAYALPEPDARQGYRFDGWYDNESCSGENVVDVNTDDSVELWAKWTKLVTLTLDFNDGSTEPAVTTHDLYDTVEELPVPEREGYRFDGWVLGKARAVSSIELPLVMDDDKLLVAQWTRIATVTLHPGQGSDAEYVRTPEGEKYTLLDPDPVDGYEFEGWYDNEDFEGDSVTSVVPDGDVELRAKWRKLEEDPVADPDDDDVPAVPSNKDGDATAAPSDEENAVTGTDATYELQVVKLATGADEISGSKKVVPTNTPLTGDPAGLLPAIFGTGGLATLLASRRLRKRK